MPKAGDIESVYVGKDENNPGEKFAVFAVTREKAGQGHGRRLLSRHWSRDDAETTQIILEAAFEFHFKG